MGVWMRNLMGLRASPYALVQGSLQAKQMVLGDPKDEKNPYQWEWVCKNLPGNKDYNPTFPWVAKVQQDGQVEADVHIYVRNHGIFSRSWPGWPVGWPSCAPCWVCRMPLKNSENLAPRQELGLVQ
jgi:hypothetical protein